MAYPIFTRGLRRLRPSSIAKPFNTKEKLILRDYLAMQRTTLANERTLFAYLRTSLYLILGGIGLLEVKTFERLKWAGYLALGISGFILIYGFVRSIALRRRLKKFYQDTGIDERQKG